MKRLGVAVMAVLAGATALTATAANAQSWGYHYYMARDAYHAADVRDIQARRDQHAADVAGLYGNTRAQRAYEHASDVRRNQAHSDTRFAHHESDVAHNAYNTGY